MIGWGGGALTMALLMICGMNRGSSLQACERMGWSELCPSAGTANLREELKLSAPRPASPNGLDLVPAVQAAHAANVGVPCKLNDNAMQLVGNTGSCLQSNSPQHCVAA